MMYKNIQYAINTYTHTNIHTHTYIHTYIRKANQTQAQKDGQSITEAQVCYPFDTRKASSNPVVEIFVRKQNELIRVWTDRFQQCHVFSSQNIYKNEIINAKHVTDI